jgi:hypothetical protein
MHRQLNGFLLERYVDTRRSQPFLRRIIPLSIGSPDDPAALHNVPPRNDRCGSCVTRIAGPNGDAQLYER